MKTRIIILSLAFGSLLISCNNDRDENVRKEAIDQVKKSNQKIKFNKSGQFNRDIEPESTKDTIRVPNSNNISLDPKPIDESEVVDPTKPDKPW